MLAWFCALCLGACTATFPLHPTVPAPRAEMVPAPPVSPVLLIWRPGHYDWDGTGYAWVAGQWVERAGHGTLWQDGYWQPQGLGSVWVPAHWM